LIAIASFVAAVSTSTKDVALKVASGMAISMFVPLDCHGVVVVFDSDGAGRPHSKWLQLLVNRG
jgi:hypothetical protein